MYFAMLIIFLSLTAIDLTVSGEDFRCDMKKVEKEMEACIFNSPTSTKIVNQAERDISKAFDGICSQQPALVEIFDCLTKSVSGCLTKEEFLRGFIPSKANWKNGVGFLCKHRAELMENPCLNTMALDLSKCFGESFEVLNTPPNVTNYDEKKRVYCRAMDLKPCIKSSKGSCNDSTVSIISQVFEGFVPLDKCQNSGAAFPVSFSIIGCFILGLTTLWLSYP